jgi:hypothetical protein
MSLSPSKKVFDAMIESIASTSSYTGCVARFSLRKGCRLQSLCCLDLMDACAKLKVYDDDKLPCI